MELPGFLSIFCVVPFWIFPSPGPSPCQMKVADDQRSKSPTANGRKLGILFWLVGKFRVSRMYLGGGFIL